MAFSPDGKLVASGSFDQTVRLWDTMTGAEQRVFKGHLGWVRTIAFSPDGNFIASGSNDQTIRLWDVITGAERYVYILGVALQFLCFSSCGKYLITDRGTLCLLLDTLNDLPTLPLIFASRTWIKENGEDFLRIHPNCQNSLLFIAKNMVLFLDDSSHSLVLRLSHPISP